MAGKNFDSLVLYFVLFFLERVSPSVKFHTMTSHIVITLSNSHHFHCGHHHERNLKSLKFLKDLP